jgi:hypothetical protein
VNMGNLGIFSVVFTFCVISEAAFIRRVGKRDAPNRVPLVVTAANGAGNATAANVLEVFNIQTGARVQTIPTGGKGGAGGNQGGIAVNGDIIAAVNYGSNSTSVFYEEHGSLSFLQQLYTTPFPVSVAFGQDHLYVLGSGWVQSFPWIRGRFAAESDGSSQLYLHDGSASTVQYLESNILIITEKSGAIESVALKNNGAIHGQAASNIPISGLNTPFGFSVRGNNAYITNAHAEQLLLVRDTAGSIALRSTISTCPSGNGGPGTTSSTCVNSPCWSSLLGPYLFTADSPSAAISRWVVYGSTIQADSLLAYQYADGSAPTDMFSIGSWEGGTLAVLSSHAGTAARINVFSIDEDGALTSTVQFAVAGPKNNGCVIV